MEQKLLFQIIHYKWFVQPALSRGEELPEKLGGDVQPAPQIPYPIYDENLRYSLPY